MHIYIYDHMYNIIRHLKLESTYSTFFFGKVSFGGIFLKGGIKMTDPKKINLLQ